MINLDISTFDLWFKVRALHRHQHQANHKTESHAWSFINFHICHLFFEALSDTITFGEFKPLKLIIKLNDNDEETLPLNFYNYSKHAIEIRELLILKIQMDRNYVKQTQNEWNETLECSSQNPPSSYKISEEFIFGRNPYLAESVTVHLHMATCMAAMSSFEIRGWQGLFVLYEPYLSTRWLAILVSQS